MNMNNCEGNCNRIETPQETINRLEVELKMAREDAHYHSQKAHELECKLHNIMELLGNPYIRIKTVDMG